MLNAGVVSYLSGGILFLILSVLLVTSWKGSLQGGVLVTASLVNTLWAFGLAWEAAYKTSPASLIIIGEYIRGAVWIIFLARLLGEAGSSMLSRIMATAFILLLSMTVAVMLIPDLSDRIGGIKAIYIPGMLLIAITSLVLVEQVYRNSRADYYWNVKYLCIGVGGLFAYELFFFSHAMLFHGIDMGLWSARGAMNALVVPLIAIAAARNPKWSLNIFVSRRIVFYATSLVGVGLYLLAMLAGGYYVRIYGGNWGGLAQATFLFGAFLVLMVILFSGQARARLKIFLSKHFYAYKYDYRDEWHRLIHTLSNQGEDTPLRERSIKAIAQIVESPGGAIWTKQPGRAGFNQAAFWNFPELSHDVEADTRSLEQYLEERRWVIDMDEYKLEPEKYSDLVFPAWLDTLPDAWLVIPLMHEASLIGFIVLDKPRAPICLNLEDYDLLKTVGSQVASYLAQYEADQQLTEARQFDAYNRLTAFIMHDLKNLIHQQSMIVKNAAKHKDNAAFIDTAIGTVDNSVRRMKKLLDQLQRGATTGSLRSIELSGLLAEVVSNCKDKSPVPELEVQDRGKVRVDPEGLSSVLGHLIRNAQEAITGNGNITVRLFRDEQWAVAEISDDGCGMDEQFIRARLFKPFDTTKGSKGMGIGVFQAREFAMAVGGGLTVTSKPGQGTTFRLRLPITNE